MKNTKLERKKRENTVKQCDQEMEKCGDVEMK